MGAESYLLRLRSQQANAADILLYCTSTLGITSDSDGMPLSSAYKHYVLKDGIHVIEFEFFQDIDSCEISLRFTLCHPSSVDHLFLALVATLMEKFNLTATICDEVPTGESLVYTVNDLVRFNANCSWSIAQRRKEWQQMFGFDTIGLSVPDTLRKYFYGENIGDGMG